MLRSLYFLESIKIFGSCYVGNHIWSEGPSPGRTAPWSSSKWLGFLYCYKLLGSESRLVIRFRFVLDSESRLVIRFRFVLDSESRLVIRFRFVLDLVQIRTCFRVQIVFPFESPCQPSYSSYILGVSRDQEIIRIQSITIY